MFSVILAARLMLHFADTPFSTLEVQMAEISTKTSYFASILRTHAICFFVHLAAFDFDFGLPTMYVGQVFLKEFLFEIRRTTRAATQLDVIFRWSVGMKVPASSM